jgi:hypothetical protein
LDLQSIRFDEQFYLDQNPDVAAGVANGGFISGLEHYRLYGEFENRAASRPIQSQGPLSFASAIPQPRMTPGERELFASFLNCAEQYLEFGTGGSTVLAASLVARSVISVDSSSSKQSSVAHSCVVAGTRITPLLLHADIGPISEWGHPLDVTFRGRWPDYVSEVWRGSSARRADLCLIDGRFRVASFLSVLLECEAMTAIMFHDFPGRKPYHVIREFADEIAKQDELVVFRRKARFDAERARTMLEKVKFEPA